ncbi:hypothetical protein ACIBG7_27280 [Nonomuraea sp. NPDC050328]|uniref:hypothetical protein n=1 Tax=Nonomuraea sp. NPDC050328 TaxID=3364361 RepID=UPI0037BA64BF
MARLEQPSRVVDLHAPAEVTGMQRLVERERRVEAEERRLDTLAEDGAGDY